MASAWMKRHDVMTLMKIAFVYRWNGGAAGHAGLFARLWWPLAGILTAHRIAQSLLIISPILIFSYANINCGAPHHGPLGQNFYEENAFISSRARLRIIFDALELYFQGRYLRHLAVNEIYRSASITGLRLLSGYRWLLIIIPLEIRKFEVTKASTDDENLKMISHFAPAII